MRRWQGRELVVATHNNGKLSELRDLLSRFDVTLISAGALDLPEPDETETSFVGNARIKAHFAAGATGIPALADDSGISVEALNGAPGVYTADWAETPNGRDFGLAMERLWRELVALGAAEPWRAAFHSTLCLAWPDGEEAIFEGRVDGHVVWPPRGLHGFGFDPMFVPGGMSETFGEMLPARKTELSHRTDAFRKLVAGCFA